MTFLLKWKHYTGGDSVVGYYPTRESAQYEADRINDEYQTDTYYVEEYDKAKLEWPNPTPEEMLDLIKRVKLARGKNG